MEIKNQIRAYPSPLAYFLGWWGIALAAVLFAVALRLAFKVEKDKKNTIYKVIRRS